MERSEVIMTYDSNQPKYQLTKQTPNHLSTTERRGRVVKTPASYSGGSVLKYGPGDRLPWLRGFVIFLSLSRWMTG
jgi:hypothetical protein